jgi:hypothetical protein
VNLLQDAEEQGADSHVHALLLQQALAVVLLRPTAVRTVGALGGGNELRGNLELQQHGVERLPLGLLPAHRKPRSVRGEFKSKG